MLETMTDPEPGEISQRVAATQSLVTRPTPFDGFVPAGRDRHSPLRPSRMTTFVARFSMGEPMARPRIDKRANVVEANMIQDCLRGRESESYDRRWCFQLTKVSYINVWFAMLYSRRQIGPAMTQSLSLISTMR